MTSYLDNQLADIDSEIEQLQARRSEVLEQIAGRDERARLIALVVRRENITPRQAARRVDWADTVMKPVVVEMLKAALFRSRYSRKGMYQAFDDFNAHIVFLKSLEAAERKGDTARIAELEAQCADPDAQPSEPGATPTEKAASTASTPEGTQSWLN